MLRFGRYRWLFSLALTLSTWPALAQDAIPGDLSDFAETHAADFADKIASKIGDNSDARIAVFPFGNEEGQSTALMGDTSKILQGELVRAIGKAANGRFFMIDAAGLAAEFRTAGRDPSGVTTGNPNVVAQVLQDLGGIEAAIVGSIQQGSSGYYSLSADIVFKDGSSNQVFGKSGNDLDILPDSNPGDAKRFQLKMAIDGQEVDLQQHKYAGTPYDGVYFAILPRSAKGKSYHLVVENHGTPAIEMTFTGVNGQRSQLVGGQDDPQRRFAVALLVDGVNSIYQDQQDGVQNYNPKYARPCGPDELAPVIVHPKNAVKWVLRPPSDGSPGKIDVGGYQISNSEREQFVLTGVGDGLASRLGITNSNGHIAAHIYAEKKSGDTFTVTETASYGGSSSSNAETRPGERENSPIVEIQLDRYEIPCKVIDLYYRYEGQDLPCDPAMLVTE